MLPGKSWALAKVCKLLLLHCEALKPTSWILPSVCNQAGLGLNLGSVLV